MTSDSAPDAEHLARLLVTQSMLGQLPEDRVPGFICRSAEEISGVIAARHEPHDDRTGSMPGQEGPLHRYPMRCGNRCHGHILLEVGDERAFAPYAPFINNLTFTAAMVLEERQLRRLTEAHREELERRVRERTAQLKEESERLSVTLRSIGDAVITTDMAGRVGLMNPVAERLTGWRRGEVERTPLETVFRLLDPNTRAPRPSPVEAVLAEPHTVTVVTDALLVSKSGEVVAVESNSAPIKDRDGQIIGAVLVFRDVTAQRHLQETIQRTEKLNAIGVLAGGIAHDFNNMLGGLFGFIDLALDAAAPGSAQQRYLQNAIGVFSRARSLTQQLLTFAKGHAPVCAVQSVGPVLQNSVAFALSGSRIAAEVEIVEGLWSSRFDADQLGRIIDNLIINAEQAMPDGGTIRVRAENAQIDAEEGAVLSPGRYVKISVQDTGVGIPLTIQSKIFDPFFTTKAKGSGLGLATCFAIVKQHDGHIDVASAPGQGTVVSVYLPAAEGVETQAPAGPAAHRGRGRIAVMDDEDFIRDLLDQMLTGMGYEVIQLADGDAMLDYCARQMLGSGAPLTAAFLDLTIPGGKGGKEVAPRLHGMLPDLPLFACSGYSEDPVIADPTAYGFTASLPKPFRKADLQILLNRFLGG